MDTTVTFNLPADLDNRLKDLAKQKLVSKSALIRMVLADHVEAQETKDTQPQPEEVEA